MTQSEGSQAQEAVSQYGVILHDTLDTLVKAQTKVVEAQQDLLAGLEERLSEIQKVMQSRR